MTQRCRVPASQAARVPSQTVHATPVAPGIRVGADLTMIVDVAQSIERFGDRYLRRVFTGHEIDSCRGEPSVVAAHLAARFAAKEATIKVLRPVVRPAWTSIEVHRVPPGWCELRLTGAAALLARDAGIAHFAVSLSCAGGVAAAVVVGTPAAVGEDVPAWTT